MRTISVIYLLLLFPVFVTAQDVSRGSIPEDLLRPGRGESSHYPIDTVIGELGQGDVSDAAFSFANSVAAGFLSGETGHSGLATVNLSLREDFLLVLEHIEPRTVRLGGGREELDGAISFMIRFIGREMGITGELFIRYVTRYIEEIIEDEVVTRTVGNWTFEDLILEDAKTRDEEYRESLQRFDFSPYERFF